MNPGFANLNYYEILDISMGVDAKEIQEGYYLLREAFSKSALASYSLYTPEEREEILKLVEEAYHILFDEPSRREYDQNLTENRLRAEKSKKTLQAALPFDEGTAEPSAAAPATPAENAPAPVATASAEPRPAGETPAPNEKPAEPASTAPAPEPASTPPAAGEPAAEPPEAEAATTAPALAAAPAAGPTEGAGRESEEEPLLQVEEAGEERVPAPSETAAPVPAFAPEPASPPAVAEPAPSESANAAAPEPNPPEPVPAPAPEAAAEPAAPPAPAVSPAAEKIHRDPEPTPGPRRFSPLDHIREGVTGPSLKRVREQHGFTLEQAWEVTRIRRPLLQSIEEEEFDKLPAVVFLRGMVSIYANFLGLPDPDAVAKSYLERMTSALSGSA